MAFDLHLEDESKGWVDVFGSINQLVIDKNEAGASYKPSADPDYIEYCINDKRYNFCLSPEDIQKLQSKHCYRFGGIELYILIPAWKLHSGAMTGLYKAIINRNKFTFKDETIIENNKKFERIQNRTFNFNKSKKASKQNGFSDIDEPQYSDGYGGYHDNEMIDDAFEGDPDNYWNVD